MAPIVGRLEGAEGAVGARVWSLAGRPRVTVAITATIEVDERNPVRVRVVSPEPPADMTEHALRSTSAGITLAGDAVAPAGANSSSLTTRLAVFRRRAGSSAEDVLVDKRIVVVGDADPRGGRSPVRSVPLTWERAIGGRHVPENPAGMSYGANLLDPADPTRPTCYAAIPRAWPPRAARLRGLDAASLAGACPDIPEAFEFGYFQAAPLDQRAERWHLTERLLLDGMDAKRPRLELYLPGARASVRVDGSKTPGTWVEAFCDYLHVDVPRRHVTCVFRAEVELTSAPAEVRVHAHLDVESTAGSSFMSDEETMLAVPEHERSRPPAPIQVPDSSRFAEPPERSSSDTLISPRNRPKGS